MIIKPFKTGSLIFTAILSIFQSFCQTGKIDSLLSLLKKDNEDTTKAYHLNALGLEYQLSGKYDSAFYYGNAALRLSEQLNFPKGMGISYNSIGIIYANQGNWAKALEVDLLYLKLAEREGDKRDLATVYNSIGVVYANLGNYPKALENYFASLKIQKEIGNRVGEAVSYNNIGLAYLDMGNYENALENILASLRIKEEMQDQSGIAGAYNNVGEIYAKKGDYEKALENYLIGLKIFRETGYKNGIAVSYYCIGDIYMHKKNYTEAVSYLLNSLRLNKELGAVGGITDVYKKLSEVNEKMEDYKNAYKYYQLYTGIKDSLFTKESSKQMADMQIRYETEKKEKENKLLVQQNELQQSIIEKRTWILVLVAGLLIVTMGIFVLLYSRYKLKQKALMEQEINRQQQLRFKAVINAEEKERRRIAQELHDGLGQLLATAKLNVSALEDMPKEANAAQVKNALSVVDNAIDEVRSISHNMMSGVLIQLGLISALRELARKITDSTKIKVELTADYNERLNDENEAAIYRIVQESVNNMLKHAKATEISITLRKLNQGLLLEIKDNGVGFDTSIIEKSSQPGGGIGWKNIYARAAMLNGNIKVTSLPTKGTTIAIDFPNLFVSNG